MDDFPKNEDLMLQILTLIKKISKWKRGASFEKTCSPLNSSQIDLNAINTFCPIGLIPAIEPRLVKAGGQKFFRNLVHCPQA